MFVQLVNGCPYPKIRKDIFIDLAPIHMCIGAIKLKRGRIRIFPLTVTPIIVLWDMDELFSNFSWFSFLIKIFSAFQPSPFLWYYPPDSLVLF